MFKNKALGSALIIAGTSVGAGILALPMVSASAGFSYAALILIALWGLTLYGALLILEVNLGFDHGASFNTLARKTLGRGGQYFINLCMMALFYCLISAYISGASHFLTNTINHSIHSHWPAWSGALIFTVVLGGLVTWHTFAVDVANRVLLVLKMVAFFAVIFLLMPQVDYHLLMGQSHSQHFALAAIPIFFTAFGFHGSVPSIVKYVGHHPKTLKRVFILGSTIPLLLYLCWEVVTLGIVPPGGTLSFQAMGEQNGTVADFINILGKSINNQWIHGSIDFFTNLAITTSFLGVSLGLFDFFADILGAKNRLARHLLTAVVTFIPPLLFAIYYPNGFIIALGYAAIPLAFIAIILPVIMIWKKDHSPQSNSKRIIKLSAALTSGIAIIALQLFL